jgi:hypothetical protein
MNVLIDVKEMLSTEDGFSQTIEELDVLTEDELNLYSGAISEALRNKRYFRKKNFEKGLMTLLKTYPNEGYDFLKEYIEEIDNMQLSSDFN